MHTPFIVTTNEIAFEAVDFKGTKELETAIGTGCEIIVKDANGAKATVIFNPDHVKYVGVQL